MGKNARGTSTNAAKVARKRRGGERPQGSTQQKGRANLAKKAKGGDEKKARGGGCLDAGKNRGFEARETSNPFFSQPKDHGPKQDAPPPTGIVLDEANVHKFFCKSPDQDDQALANFAVLAVVVQGKKYKTGEHAFHACKFQCVADLEGTSSERKGELLDHKEVVMAAKGPMEAKKCGGRCELSVPEIEAWSKAASPVQKQICEYKLERYSMIRRVLLMSDKKYLLHQEDRGRKPVWGGRMNQQTNELVGENKLGLIWMELRDSLFKVEDDFEDDGF
jgi:ribA/ribD-fused uncharacterized protein